jgi:soluble lytic murein transglycosylase-like protein
MSIWRTNASMERLLPILIGLTIALSAFSSGVARDTVASVSEEQQSALCSSALRTAEQKYRTPPGLLDAIARAESGRRVTGAKTLQPWPWALNVDGRGLYFATKEQAIAWTRKALERGSNATDVGCMQVDLQFHPSAFQTLEEAYDPETNADYAARFLVSLYESMGANWFVAAGLYHSRSPDLARQYRDQITAVSAGVPARKPSKLRLVLSGGGVVVINTRRQPSRLHRQLTACQVATVLGPYLRSSARAGVCGISGVEKEPAQ